MDGGVTVRELARHGDTGLGTVDGLDGEMVVVEGVFYRVPTTARSRSSIRTPARPSPWWSFSSPIARRPSRPGATCPPWSRPWKRPAHQEPVFRRAPDRDLRTSQGPQRSGPDPPLSAPGQGRGRAERVRSGEGAGDHGRLPLPEKCRWAERARLAFPFHLGKGPGRKTLGRPCPGARGPGRSWPGWRTCAGWNSCCRVAGTSTPRPRPEKARAGRVAGE